MTNKVVVQRASAAFPRPNDEESWPTVPRQVISVHVIPPRGGALVVGTVSGGVLRHLVPPLNSSVGCITRPPQCARVARATPTTPIGRHPPRLVSEIPLRVYVQCHQFLGDDPALPVAAPNPGGIRQPFQRVVELGLLRDVTEKENRRRYQKAETYPGRPRQVRWRRRKCCWWW